MPARRLLAAVVLVLLLLPAGPVSGDDSVSRAVATVEAFVPLAFLVAQGTDTGFEFAVFSASVGLHTVPNVLMLYAERTERPQLTAATRWFNFGVDSATAAGLLGAGIAYLAGAFGPESDTRSRGGVYLALAIPAAVAAYADFLPLAVGFRRSSPSSGSASAGGT
jgi:hypothetical protein